MNKILLALALLLFSPLSSGITLINESAMTGEKVYTYYNYSKDKWRYYFTVTCNPKYGLSLSVCYKKYEYLSDYRCHNEYDYKFDDGAIEKRKWVARGMGQESPGDRRMIERMLEHKKLIVAPYPGSAALPTPVFDLSTFRSESKKFAHEKKCSLSVSPTEPEQAPTESTDGNLSHSHAGRSHQHPLPKEGVAHRHGGGAVGAK